MSSGDSSQESPKVDERYSYPLPLPQEIAEEEEEAEEVERVFLCALPAGEADAFCQWLESEGVPCAPGPVETDGKDTSGAVRVQVLVQESELEFARELLASPRRPHTDDPEEQAFERESEKSLADHWICPKCRERTLEVVPLSPGWRRFRLVLLAIVILPILAVIIAWAGGVEGIRIPDNWQMGWIILICLSAGVLVWLSREKRCKKCGWETGREDDEGAE